MRRTKRNSRPKRFIKDITTHTPFAKMIFLLVILWLVFSTGLYFAERGIEGATITSYGDALYWGLAAVSTAGIADTPRSDIAQLVGGIWIVAGPVIIFWNSSGNSYNLFYASNAASCQKDNQYD